jgi:hypothetical protein
VTRRLRKVGERAVMKVLSHVDVLRRGDRCVVQNCLTDPQRAAPVTCLSDICSHDAIRSASGGTIEGGPRRPRKGISAQPWVCTHS